MADLMEIVRAALARSVKETEERGISPAPAPTTDPLTPFATFAPPTAWDQRQANRLMQDADALVEHLGVDGRDPEVKSAAAMVESANATRDMETLLYALAEFDVAVRRVRKTSPAR